MNPRDHIEGAGAAVAEEPTPLTLPGHLRLSALWFGLNFQGAALFPIVLPTEIVLFITPTQVGSARQVIFFGYLSAVGALVAMLAPPLVGALSDHTPGPMGRRRPYIVVGGVLLIVGVFEMAAARDVARFVLGFLLFQLGSNVSTAAYQGLIPDLVPERQRGFASGLLGLMTILGTVASLGLAAILFNIDLAAIQNGTGGPLISSAASRYFTLTGFALVLILVLTTFGVHEYALGHAAPHTDDSPHEHRSLLARFDAAWIAPFRHRNFAWVFLTRGFVFVGLTLFMTYIEYYFGQLGENNFAQSTAILASLALLGAVGSSVVLGVLSDRLPRVPIVVVSCVFMAGAALAFVAAPLQVPLLPLGIAFGVGYGGYLSVDWALAVDALPSRTSAGKDMGIWGVASNLPTVIAPLIGAQIITRTRPILGSLPAYQLVFLVAAIFLLGGGVFVLAVREAPRPRRDRGRRTGGRARRRWVLPGWLFVFRAGAGRARGFLRFWPVWEAITRRVGHVRAIPGAADGLFEVRFFRYHGQPMTLPDGTVVARGDRIVELHVRNDEMIKISENVSFRQAFGGMRRSLRGLAAWSHQADFPRGVRAVYGRSLLARAAPRLGFTTRDVPRTVHLRLERFFLLGIMVMYHARGRERLGRGTTYSRYPVECWLSLDDLRRRYGERAEAAEAASLPPAEE